MIRSVHWKRHSLVRFSHGGVKVRRDSMVRSCHGGVKMRSGEEVDITLSNG